ncbi:MAG TPA: YcdB/YcdC domain-containing protein [Desulfosporosinus sp.]|nr:YcdB/YcdC domain-containing protein [Desulfosporosinus sp.]
MQKIWRHILAVIGVLLMLVQMISGPVALAGESSSSTATQTLAMPEITLEKAILIVRTNFDVPSEYTDFTSTYNTNDDRQVWSLHWNSTTGRQGDFSAEVSALNGDILSMNNWRSDEESSNSEAQPAITKLSAQEISNNLLARLLGERAGQLRLLPNDQMVVPLSNYSPVNYSFQYQRLINDLPFLSNGVNVQVSSIGGYITSYNLNWSEVKAPEVKGVINVDQAQQAFTTASFLKLEYWASAPFKLLVAGQKQEAKLVYQLRGQSGGAIDALTGEPLQLGMEDWLATDALGIGGMGSAKENRAVSDSSGTLALSPQEQEEVERTAKLLKRDEAISAVQRWIEIPENLTLRSANLGTGWRNADKPIWSFDWSNTGAENEEGKPQFLSARVSATTGELLGFNISYPPTEKPVATLDRTALQKLAEEFLKRVQPDRFSQVALDSENSSDVKMSPEPWNTQYFSYHRVANGVDFPDNGMTVNVEPATGVVTGYELNWLELDLPGLSGVLSKDRAVESFLKARPLALVYVRIYSKGLPGSLRLVYLPIGEDRSIPLSNTMDAKSGELLDYQGQPLEKGPKPYNFTDLSGVNGAQEIAALGQAGLFGEFGNSFKPLEKMSLVSLLRAMYLSRFGLSGNTSLTEGEVISKAKELGWLKEDLQPGDNLNRELLAKVLLRYIQLNKLAELKDTYQVNFQDAAEISSDALGYIALASGTGILKIEGQVLAPHETLNRAEAAVALYRALTWVN